MIKPTPEDRMTIEKARISWAASFLVDWLIPLIEDNRIHDPNEIIQLREEFPPIPVENKRGIDFTISDILQAALQWEAYQQKLYPHVSIEKLPSGKAFRKAIKLLTAAVQNSEQTEHWTQTTFLTD